MDTVGRDGQRPDTIPCTHEDGVASMMAKASRHLARDPLMRALNRRHGPCPLAPRRGAPYETLMRAIAHQQLNGRAAKTILERFVALFPNARFPTPAAVLAARTTTLRRAGFSRAKVRALKDIARHAVEGVVPTRREGFRVAYGRRTRPTPKALRAYGERWKPYRSVAAWYLWQAAGEARRATN